MEGGRDKVAMQVQVMTGVSWKLRTIEIHRCNKCGYEYTFPRYDDILKIAEIRTGRCSEVPTSSRIFKNYILIISYNLEHVR